MTAELLKNSHFIFTIPDFFLYICAIFLLFFQFPRKMGTRNIYTIALLVLSNTFMTFAWYGHLKFKKLSWFQDLGLFSIILISWGIAFFEYCAQVPANRLGFSGNGGSYSLVQLKVLQEVITLLVFTAFTLLYFKGEMIRWNHLVGFVFLVMAVYFIFKK